jgi:hypothetical protein
MKKKIISKCLSLFLFSRFLFWEIFFSFRIFQFANSLDMTNTKLLLLFTLITQFVLQTTQPVLVSRVIDVKYGCNYPGCSTPTIIYVSTLGDCKVACSNHAGCRTVTFDPDTHKCGLFFDTPNQNCKSLPQANVATMSTSDDKQVSTSK